MVGNARHAEKVARLVADGALSAGAASLEHLVAQPSVPRTVWLMVPATAVDATLADLVPILASGDTVVDGANSYYRDDLRRSNALAERGIVYVDVGVSGGGAGLEADFADKVLSAMRLGFGGHVEIKGSVWN